MDLEVPPDRGRGGSEPTRRPAGVLPKAFTVPDAAEFVVTLPDLMVNWPATVRPGPIAAAANGHGSGNGHAVAITGNGASAVELG